jgi:hypothetical protein
MSRDNEAREHVDLTITRLAAAQHGVSRAGSYSARAFLPTSLRGGCGPEGS